MIRATRIRLIISVLAVFLALPAGAQSVAPVGSVVNVGPGYQPGVVTLPSGDFVVVWQSSGYVDGSVVAGGVPGVSFPVSGTLANSPVPDIASDSAGNFVVAWNDNIYYAANAHVQLFDSAASPVGSEVVIATGGGSFSFPSPPKVDLNDSGQFVVTWGTPYGGAIWAQGFGPSAFTAFPISSGSNPDVAVDSAGNFLVTWQSYPYVWGQTFDSTGAPIALSPFVIGGGTGTDPAEPSVDTLGASGFVVVWNEGFSVGKAARQPFTDGDVWARFADTAGATGTQFLVAASPGSLFYTSGAKVSANGSNFVVTWLDGLGFSDPLNVQVMDNAGSPVGSAFTTTATASWNSVSINDNGTFTVAWNPGTVYGQVFQVCVAPVAPTLTAPANGTFLPEASPVNFSWSNTGADDYDLTYSVDAGSPTVVNVPLGATSTSISLPPGAITWSVVSNYLNCPSSSASATGSFTVCPTPAEPARVAPVDATTFPAGSVINFQWNAVANAVGYDVYVKVDGGAASLLGSTVAPTTTLSQAVSSGAIEWYVIANFTAGCSSSPVPATLGTFTVCPTPTEPTRVAPVDGSALNAPISFQWNAVTGATDYDVWVSVNGGTFALQGNSTTTSLTNQTVAPGSIDWYVVANFGGTCASSPVPTVYGTFTVCPIPTEPGRTAPADGSFISEGTPITFQWSAVTAATDYDVWVRVNGGTFALQGNSTTTSLANQTVAAGSIDWYVIANYGGICSPSSPPSIYGNFTICPTPAEPSRVAPTDGSSVAEGTPVTFQWTAVANALDYKVWVRVNGGAFALQGTATTTSLANQTIPPGSIEWYVVANFSNPSCPSSAVPTTFGNFTVCKTPTAATLVSPANGATVSSPVIFQWTAVTGATGYEVFAGVGGTPSLVGTTTGTSLSVALPEGVGDWYVVAKFGAGCPTASSSTSTFVVEAPFVCPTPTTPNLLAPSDGAEFAVGDLVQFQWSAAAGASSYQVWGKVNGAPAKLLGATGNTFLNRAIEEGTTEWYVITTFGPGCGTSTTSTRTIKTAEIEPPPPPVCGLTDAPLPSIVAEATTGEEYVLRWDALEGAVKYHVQESSNASFIGGIIQEVTQTEREISFKHPNLTVPTPFFYRVAGIPSCDENKLGPYSTIIRVVGLPKPEPSSTNPQVVSEFGNEEFVETFLFIPGFGTTSKTTSVATFEVSSNEPWLTVTPPSGTLPPEGTTVTLLADPTGIGLGANTATVTVTRDDGLGKTTLGSSTKGVPVVVSLVTPVSPTPKTAGPPENALIIPAVANVTGATSKWFSDVKITNRSGQLINYQLNFSATDQSGTVNGKQTKITIRPGQTVALDDVVRQWYGYGDLADGTNGALEIRPINFTGKAGTEAAPLLATVASSRTYTRSENSLASYGQFIPAVPFSSFLKSGVENSLLMMQQVSQTASLRTNFGLVEGAGKDVNVLLTAYDREGTTLGEFPVSLKAGEHKQLNSLLALNNISVEDGRMSVKIVSGDGAVTSYASVVAAGTGDPTLVPGVDPSNLSAKRYVLAGVADLRAGSANWRSDVRIFNPNQTAETVNVFFYPQGETTPLGPVEIRVQPGQISVLPGVIDSLFGRQDLGGALHVVPISGQSTSLLITGETYDVSELGKYGQFITAVTEENAIGVGSPGLEVMQVEASDQFRTNLGLAEVTGQPATVQIQLTVPNSLVAPTKVITLGGNEFQQLNGIVRSMAGGRDVYNGRLTVRVMGGAGKITAYGSTVDNQTRDATFSPGQ